MSVHSAPSPAGGHTTQPQWLPPSVERALWWLVLGAGVWLRIRQFVFNRSLWLDEAYLAASFTACDLVALLTEPLANGQAAPLGFLLVSKTLFELFGRTDWSLRLLPLLSGLLGLWAGWRLSLLVFKQPLARLVFVALLTVSPVLIYYSSEFKQYGSDVAVALVLLWCGLAFQTEQPARGAWRLAVLGSLAVWLSHPSVFVLTALGTTLFVQLAHQRQWRAVWAIGCAGLAWSLSFGVNYAVSLKAVAASPTLSDFWLAAYAPWPVWDSHVLWWYPQNLMGLVHLALRHEGVAHHGSLDAWTDAWNVALSVAVVCGLVALFRQQRRMASLLCVLLALTVLASGLHLYPFRSRLILFLVPVVCIGLAACVESLMALMESRRRFSGETVGAAAAHPSPVAWAAGLGLAVFVVFAALPQWRHPHNESDIKGALAYVQAHREAADSLMASSWTAKALLFYQSSFALKSMSTYIFTQTTNPNHDARATLRRACLRGAQRLWLVVSHRFSERAALLGALAPLAPTVDRWEGTGAAAYLLDLSGSSYCAKYRTPTRVGPG